MPYVLIVVESALDVGVPDYYLVPASNVDNLELAEMSMVVQSRAARSRVRDMIRAQYADYPIQSPTGVIDAHVEAVVVV